MLSKNKQEGYTNPQGGGGETKVVQCRTNINATSGKFPVHFESDIEQLLMSDLEVNQTILNVHGGASCKVGVQVSKPTNHDIVLKKSTVLRNFSWSNLLLH